VCQGLRGLSLYPEGPARSASKSGGAGTALWGVVLLKTGFQKTYRDPGW